MKHRLKLERKTIGLGERRCYLYDAEGKHIHVADTVERFLYEWIPDKFEKLLVFDGEVFRAEAMVLTHIAVRTHHGESINHYVFDRAPWDGSLPLCTNVLMEMFNYVPTVLTVVPVVEWEDA